MKFLTLEIPGCSMPVTIIFSGHLDHKSVATKLGGVAIGAGFVRLGEKVDLAGFSPSLGVGPSQVCGPLMRAGIKVTNAMYPAKPYTDEDADRAGKSNYLESHGMKVADAVNALTPEERAAIEARPFSEGGSANSLRLIT